MKRKLLSLLILGLSSASVLAAASQMVCKNPRQSYLATFDDEANIFRLGSPGPDTFYQIERAENKENGWVVEGKTVKGGPGFVAYFGKNKRIEYIDDGQIMQTDPCK